MIVYNLKYCWVNLWNVGFLQCCFVTANGIIRSDVVHAAMLFTDRGKYAKHNPYTDAPQGIGYGVTISAPHMHAHALELLKDHLTAGERALDVGCGSGYLTVCMALMVGETGKAIGIDRSYTRIGRFRQGQYTKWQTYVVWERTSETCG